MEFNVLIKIKTYINSFKRVNFKNTINLIKPCDVLLFCHDVDRGISLDGRAYSPLIDSIKDELEAQGFACVSIAHPWSEIIGDNGYGHPIAINRSYFFAKLLMKIFGDFSFGCRLNLYRKIIRKSKPRAIITIGCNDDLCEAARVMNVFHVELLHGIGYTPLPWGWDKKEKKHLPQGVFSLDPVSTKTFSYLKKYDVIIKEIRHPFFKMFKEENVNKIPCEWLPVKKDFLYKKEVLISLQWGYAPGIDEQDFFMGILSNGLFYKELEEVITATHDTVFWRFRFHPVQYRQPEKYKALFEFMESFITLHKNCDWRESTFLPLPSLLRQCSGHITMSSMTNYEAAYLGVTTLALCPSLRTGGIYEEFFQDLVEHDYLIKARPKFDIILEWVTNVERREPLITDLEGISDFEDVIEGLFLREK